MKLGKRIRAERLHLQLTQVELARAIGVGSDTISKYERDQMVPSVPTLQSLARVFGVSMDELCGNKAA